MKLLDSIVLSIARQVEPFENINNNQNNSIYNTNLKMNLPNKPRESWNVHTYSDNLSNKSNVSSKSIKTAVYILIILIVLSFITFCYAIHLCINCNHGNNNSFLIELVLIIFLAWSWIPLIIYCIWKSRNCVSKRRNNNRKNINLNKGNNRN